MRTVLVEMGKESSVGELLQAGGGIGHGIGIPGEKGHNETVAVGLLVEASFMAEVGGAPSEDTAPFWKRATAGVLSEKVCTMVQGAPGCSVMRVSWRSTAACSKSLLVR